MQTTAEKLSEITNSDLPNLSALFELVLSHPDIEQSPALFGGCAAIRDQLHAVWNKLEEIECPMSTPSARDPQPEAA